MYMYFTAAIHEPQNVITIHLETARCKILLEVMWSLVRDVQQVSD